MSFTSFLFTIIIILVLGFSLNTIINSRAFRIWIITQRDYLHQKEIEKEMQKTRQRTIDEIKNPDRVMEVIMKIKRGEEVKIPLAAFDYIYRNMKNFSIVDKDGRISIINQEDYFRFKKEALSLLEKDTADKIDVKQILADIERRVAENPIEITKHEDGTIVKVNHVSRTAEISKPNGEMIIIDHKTNTMVSQNLIEKPDQRPNRQEIILKDAQIKKTSEENLLLKGKLQKSKDSKNEIARTKVIKESDDITELNNFEDENLLLTHKTILTRVENRNLTELGIRKRVQFATEQQEQKTIAPQSEFCDKPLEPQNNLLDYQSIESFQKNAISFQNIYDFTKDLIIKEMSKSDIERIENVLKTYIIDTNSIKRNSDTLSTPCKPSNGLDNELKHSSTSLITHRIILGVIYDQRSSCFLVNINYLFLKLSSLLNNESIKLWFDSFYSDQKKLFVNNETLTNLIAHINNKSSLALGAKLFMQEKKENTTINFRTVKIKIGQEAYQGQYLYLFTANSFCKSLVQEYEAKMEIRDLEIDNDLAQKGEKITLFTLL